MNLGFIIAFEYPVVVIPYKDNFN